MSAAGLPGLPGLPRRALGRAGAGALSVLAASRALPAAAQTEVVDDELRIITLGLMAGLDPAHRTSASRLRAAGAAEGLLRITPQGGIEPELASGYASVDPATWEVQLRPGLTFWSGAPVDAAAVAESLERARRLVPFAASQLQGVRVEPVDAQTLRFAADQPIPGLPIVLAGEWLVVHNAAAFGPQVNAFDVGVADLTGCFRITSFEPGVGARFERYPGYWGVVPRASRLRLDEVTDVEARTLAALSGEAHVVRAVSPASARQLERSRSMRIEAIPSDSVWHIFLNARRPQLSDPRVRQALAWAVDREEMVALAHDGWSVAAPSWLATDPAYPEARRVGFLRQDLTRANQLLDEAGWRLPAGGRVRTLDGAPLRFRLLWWGGLRPMAEVLQAQLAKVGVELDVQGAPDYGFLQARHNEGDWDALIEGWGTFGDPATVLARHIAGAGDLNYAALTDPGFESLLAGFATLLDPEERRQQALKINARHAEIVPFIPVTQSLQLNAVNRKVRNYVPHFLPWVYEVHPDLWAGQ